MIYNKGITKIKIYGVDRKEEHPQASYRDEPVKGETMSIDPKKLAAGCTDPKNEIQKRDPVEKKKFDYENYDPTILTDEEEELCEKNPDFRKICIDTHRALNNAEWVINDFEGWMAAHPDNENVKAIKEIRQRRNR